ncbi:MAG: aminopeptidase P N-terminal domain-containing protein [Candidatus Baltobacteraceae bacterium]
MNVYAERRDEVARRIGAAVAIVPAARHALRNSDAEYDYRQNSDFHYLTGFGEPEAVLLIAPSHPAERDVLFVRPRDRLKEIWTGKRAGVEGAVAEYGMHAAYPIDELPQRLADYLSGVSTVYYGLGTDEEMDRTVFAAAREARRRARRGGTAPTSFVEPGTVLHELRLRKSPEELALMRRAAAASLAGHEAGMRATRPGLYEHELEAIIEYGYRRAGALAVAYPSIVAGGGNATILHYNTNRDVLRDGDLVLVDSGAEVELYASDVTRTWPVSGRFTAEQRAIYEIVLRAQFAAIDQVRPGRSFDAYHESAARVLAEGLIDIGLLAGSVDEARESGKLQEFYPHRTGHYLGLDVHDAGPYTDAGGNYRTLEPGVVLTVEPGLYVQPDLDVPERWKGIGVRIEDDIVCTEGDPENLTAAIPKSIEELEAIVGSEAAASAR